MDSSGITKYVNPLRLHIIHCCIIAVMMIQLILLIIRKVEVNGKYQEIIQWNNSCNGDNALS